MFFQVFKYLSISFIAVFTTVSCFKEEALPDLGTELNSDVLGFNLLSDISGHWVGKNETSFGVYDWFAFDFRPISSSHIHSIYEGASAQNIINSFFVAKFDGKNQIMARNGGWLGSQYRASYFILEEASEDEDKSFYRLVDAKGGINRSYMELTFENDQLKFEGFKDNSGELDQPVLHMSFTGININPELAQEATRANLFPKNQVEKNMENNFDNLVDNDAALFLEESKDPFPRSDHKYLSELKIEISRLEELKDKPLMLYLSSEPIVNDKGQVDLNNLENKLIRTIDIYGDEDEYTATYLHPDHYYVTVFSDKDDNDYPSDGDYSSKSTLAEVMPESFTIVSNKPEIIISTK